MRTKRLKAITSAAIETLEQRRLLSVSVINGVLTVADGHRPTARHIVINIDATTGDYDVVDNGVSQEFPAAGIDCFSISGGQSANFIEINATFPDQANLNLIQGGPQGDTIIGGASGHELIFSGNGDDSIEARGPDEFISGENGADTIVAGPGPETIDGGNGNDSVQLGSGHEIATAGNGRDTLIGGKGHDSLVGGAGSDKIMVTSSTAFDTLVAGTGSSTLIANFGHDSLDGSGGGNDLLDGLSGFDTVRGATGNLGMDSILSATGDSITAGTRDDVINPEVFSNESISAMANIYGAGHSSPPDPSGNGAGILPPEFDLPPDASILTFTSVTGKISLNNGYLGEFNDPDDGGSSSNYSIPVGSFSPLDGLAGIKAPGQGWLVGVFESGSEPSGTPPTSLDFTSIGTNFTSLSPLLDQPFFVGDGLTGDGTGAAQQFHVPAGATRLFLGIADGSGGAIGYYYDNSGSFTASFQVTPAAP
ncbi:MAG: calcium-binding protein [Tepidisphaeraceae bacterium]|jgi:Ca2+-binding RTX toxin-like protein